VTLICRDVKSEHSDCYKEATTMFIA